MPPPYKDTEDRGCWRPARAGRIAPPLARFVWRNRKAVPVTRAEPLPRGRDKSRPYRGQPRLPMPPGRAEPPPDESFFHGRRSPDRVAAGSRPAPPPPDPRGGSRPRAPARRGPESARGEPPLPFPVDRARSRGCARLRHRARDLRARSARAGGSHRAAADTGLALRPRSPLSPDGAHRPARGDGRAPRGSARPDRCRPGSSTPVSGSAEAAVNLPPPWKIRVDVYNGTRTPNAATEVANEIGGPLAYRIGDVGNADRNDYVETRVYFPPGAEAIAGRLAEALGVSITALPGGKDDLRLVVIVGSDRA